MQTAVKVEPAIAEVLNRFDFLKVRTIMEHLNWVWSGGGKSHTPTVEELRAKAEEMLRRLDPTAEYDCIITGGFHASARRGKEIRLAFELVHTSEWIPQPQKIPIAA